jgi:hypothetical protein
MQAFLSDTPPYKPEGYTSVAPYLIVDGADRPIALELKYA